MNANLPVAPCFASERELIQLVERMWEIECRRLLGLVSTLEYRKKVVALLRIAKADPTDDGA